MAKYRKKPVVIEAVQWIGGPHCQAQIRSLYTENNKVAFLGCPPHEVRIETLEGTMKADFGDWIIKGVQGELYLCKPDIFEQTYEPVEGE